MSDAEGPPVDGEEEVDEEEEQPPQHRRSQRSNAGQTSKYDI